MILKTNLNTFYFCLLLFVQLFSGHLKAQKNDGKVEILCEPTDISVGRLPDNSWTCTLYNEKQYRKIIGKKSDIDFKKFSVVGVVYSAGGCTAPTVTHYVYFIVDSNTYRFELNIQENGTCKNLFQGYIWCTVPKIQSSKKINFIKKISVKP